MVSWRITGSSMYSATSWIDSVSVMGIDVDDQEVLVFAVDRLLRGMLEQRRGVELLDRAVAKIGDLRVHGECLAGKDLPRRKTDSRLRQPADPRHRLPGTELEDVEAGRVEHGT